MPTHKNSDSPVAGLSSGGLPTQGRVGMTDLDNHAPYTFTPYFENEVLRKRPYIQKYWCIRIIQNPDKKEPQEKDRLRFWGRVPELNGRYLRVITLADQTTIHNAFPDRRFKP